MSEKLATNAWHGISIKAPADWSLVGISGDSKQGYFRVDSPVESTVEVKWSPSLGKAPDLMVKGRELLSKMDLESRKKKMKFSSKLRQDRDSTEPSVLFQWESDRLCQGRMLYCAKCDRLIIAQVISMRDEDLSRVSPAILGSLKDHRDDGWVDWGLYGLKFAVPASYKIEKHTLLSGYLSLSFKNRQRRLVVERWGLAETILAEYALSDWYRRDSTPDMKGYRFELVPDQVRDHDGLRVEGRRGGVRMAARAAASSLTLHPHPGLISGYVWHCTNSNRLFSVRATHTEGEDIAAKIRDLIKCH